MYACAIARECCLMMTRKTKRMWRARITQITTVSYLYMTGRMPHTQTCTRIICLSVFDHIVAHTLEGRDSVSAHAFVHIPVAQTLSNDTKDLPARQTHSKQPSISALLSMRRGKLHRQSACRGLNAHVLKQTRRC